MNKYERERLNKVTGEWLRDTYKMFIDHEGQGGCAHIYFANTACHRVCVCVGWTKVDVDDGPEKWLLAWKIGWETFNNHMRCDFDFDFDIDFGIPWNTKAYCDKMNAKLTEEEKRRGVKYCEGDVYDTTETIELKDGRMTPAGYRDWNALAAFIRKTAREVLAYAREVDTEESDD